MNIKRMLQWAILAVCLIASVLNLLYLTGVCSQQMATAGTLLVFACWALLLLLRRRISDAPAADDTPLERVRGILTAVFAVLWLITTGMGYFWKAGV